MKSINNKRESFGKNILNTQSEQMSNYGNVKNKENSEMSSNGYKKRTFRESELDEEELIINDSNNDVVNLGNKMSKNNFMKENPTLDEENIEDYKRIYDKEVSNKIKYELQKDLLNKQKKSYNMMISNNNRNKSEAGSKKIIKNNLIDKSNDKKRTKLTLFDLETSNDKEIKEIEKLLKGGVDENKLNKLENIYKDNKEIMSIINSYKSQKSNLDNNYMGDSLSNSIKIININRTHKKNASASEIKPNDKKGKMVKLPKSHYNNSSLGNNYVNQSQTSIKDYLDLSPFYYISNGNKISKNMWGYNDKNSIASSNNYNNNNNMSKEEIIQNKLKIYKEKLYKPFFDKVEKEKNNELKRVQILNSINDPTLKSNLENKFGIERGKIDLELNKEKEKINRAIKKYEKELIMNESKNMKAMEQNNIFFD